MKKSEIKKLIKKLKEAAYILGCEGFAKRYDTAQAVVFWRAQEKIEKAIKIIEVEK